MSEVKNTYTCSRTAMRMDACTHYKHAKPPIHITHQYAAAAAAAAAARKGKGA